MCLSSRRRLLANGAAVRDRRALAAHRRPRHLVGPYKLLQQIGEGGFGVVYMAEQQGRCAGWWP